MKSLAERAEGLLADPVWRARAAALAPAAAYLAVVLFLFGGVLASRGVVLSALGEDLVDYYLGMRRFGFSELARGNLPLWNPLLFSGIPYFSNFESALLYPLNWHYLLLPLDRAVNLGIALHLWLAGLFAYLWGRGRGAGRPGAFVSGLVFMLAGPYFMHVYPGHLSNLCVMAWTPLLFLALDRWFESGDPRWLLLGAFVVAMQILAGHPQYVYYAAMGAVAYSWLRLRDDPRILRLGLGAASMYAAAALLTAVQLLPGILGIEEMSRSSNTQYQFARTFSLAPENLLTLLMPGFFGDIVESPYHGRWHLWEGSVFMGVGGLALACFGAAAPSAKRGRADLGMALLFVVLALGAYTPLYDLLYEYLPGFGLFRGSSKLIHVASLFLAALAGAGFDRMLADGRPTWRAAAAAFALGVLMTAAWAWLSLPLDLGQLGAWKRLFEALSSTKESFFPVQYFHSTAAVRAAMDFAAGEFLACGRAFLFVALFLYLRGFDRRWTWGLAALTALELGSFAHRNTITAPLRPAYPAAWRAAATPERLGDGRVLHIGYPRHNPLMSEGVADAWGYGPLYLTRYARLMEFVWKLSTGGRRDAKKMLAENPILSLFRARLIFLNNDRKEILDGNAMPRVSLLHDWVVIKDPEKVFARLMAPGFDPRRTAVLEAPPEPRPAKPARPGRAAVLRAGTDELEVEVELESPALLLVTDPYSKFWRARPLAPGPQARYEVVPADYALRAVPLAAGRHRLLMEFRPPGFEAGRWISLAAWLAFAAACAALLRRRAR